MLIKRCNDKRTLKKAITTVCVVISSHGLIKRTYEDHVNDRSSLASFLSLLYVGPSPGCSSSIPVWPGMSIN